MLLALLARPASLAAQAVAFVGVDVVPMNRDAVLADRTVVVRDGIIVAVGPSEDLSVPDDARRIDGRGRWLAPGLVDAHVHLFSRSDLDLYLANGVTTIVNLGGYGAADSILEIRRRVEDGHRRGPTIYTSGNWIDGDPPVREINTVVRDGAEARAEVRRQREAGYDFIKVYVTLSAETYGAIVNEAGRLGMPVTGHVPARVGLDAVLRSGQWGIAHAAGIVLRDIGRRATDGQLQALARRVRDSGLTVTSTLWMAELAFKQRSGPTGIAEVAAREEMRYLPPDRRTAWREDNMFADYPRVSVAEGKARMRLIRRFVAAMVEAGVPVLAGTDSDVAGSVPGYSIHEELRNLAEAGLEPFEVLRSATALPGDHLESVLDLTVPFGTVEVGSRADLILLAANPLEKLESLRDPLGMMVRGEWIEGDDLSLR